jgi:mannosyl-oligosaccharide glucosidase
MIPFVTHVLSNLYGGLTYYYGRLYTQNSLLLHKQDSSYSFTPSRLIFPRSFLWDDGFHSNVIVNYNSQIVFDVWLNWINKIDIFGWIGREQIRGAEISSMMPDEKFVYQDWFEMNPPTLMLPLLSMMKLSKSDKVLK